MRRLLLGISAALFASATGAQAQQGPGQASGGNSSGTGEFNRQQNFRDFYVGVADSSRLTMRPVPASPRDILRGLEVHDAKGIVIGKVETVGKDFARVTGPVGSVEVEFSSFAKNKNGLLINMPKSKIDALMVRRHPAP
jgi:hypothetical protein